VLVGLALVTPIGVTLFIANWLFVLVTNLFLPKELQSSAYQALLRIATLVTVLVICFFIGFFARSFFGKRLYRMGDKLITRVPVLNWIYVQVRHISEALIAQRKRLLKEVVLVEYPRKGVYSVGFITAATPPSMSSAMRSAHPGGEFVSLFIPTTPNPTSGMMIMARREDLVPLAIDVTDAMKFIISGGAVYPEDQPSEPQLSLLDKLEEWIAPTELKPDAHLDGEGR